MQDRVERNMMSPEALSTVIAPVCTGFEQTFKDIQLSVKPKSRSSLSKFDIQKHVAVNKQWMDIWKIMIEERVVLIHALNQKHLQYGDEEGPSMWYISPAYQHYLEHSNCKTLPAKQGGERRYPAPQDDELIYQTAPPMTGNENTIPIIHPNNPETRQKKHSTGFRPPSLPKSIFRKTNTLRRMLSSSALR
jgi:hypothetical protein